MLDPVKPPKNDELIERQQFYAIMAVSTQQNSRAIGSIGEKLDILAVKYEKVHETVQASETRNRTLIRTAIFIWAVASGGVSWILERYIDHADQSTTKIEVLEKRVTAAEPEVAKIKDLTDKLESMKRLNAEMQRQLDAVDARKK